MTIAPGRRVAPALAALLDLVLVVLFAALGRASHHEGSPVLGTLATAAPFLAGAAVGWVVVLAARRRAPVSVRDGVPVWVCAVLVGMLLRRATDHGTAWAFVAVATAVLGVLLLGWRLVGVLVGAVRSRP